MRSGLTWSFGGNLLGRLGGLLASVVVARLLSPDDLGVYAVALIVQLLLLGVTEGGLASTITRWPGSLDRVAPTAVTLIFSTSVAVYAVLFATAPWVASVFSAPNATGVIRLLGVGVIIDGAFLVPTVVLTRSFRQDRRTAADLSGFGVSTVVTIVLAAHGLGAWSLAWGRLLGDVAAAVLIFVLAPRRYRPGLDVGQARELLSFGVPRFAASILYVCISNIDVVIVGGILGPVPLGFWVLATTISNWPANVVLVAVRRVSLAGFSRIQGDTSKLASGFTRSLTLLLGVTLPPAALIAVLAGPLITFLYGDPWAPATAALRYLAIVGALRIAFELMEDLLVAAGRPRLVMAIYAASLAAVVPGIAVGATADGTGGAAFGRLVVGLAVIGPCFVAGAARAGVRPRDVLASLRYPVVAALLAAAGAALCVDVVGGDFPRLALGGAVGSALALTTLLLAFLHPLRRPAIGARP
ncbi:MAG TPA: oligosaccharide flippase family protein [Candidatus Dormibacteraeota bacterium]|nr:oligosaccharide flippase family protein [Candidatus Dormibacteraeota bacterium]